MKRFVHQATEKFLIACLVLIPLIPNFPIFTPIPTRDSGVFLYVGWRILNGELPYRDVWDHKPPLIYYINALGLLLTDNSRLGVWIIEFIFLFIAALFGFQLLKKLFGFYPSATSLILWLLTLSLLFSDGNLTSEYTLPLQFLALSFFHDLKYHHRPWQRWFFIGLTGAVAFFIKQTTIGIWIGIILISFFKMLKDRQYRKWQLEFLSFSAGFAVISIVIVAFFAYHDVLAEFWNVAFEYNFSYLSTTRSLAERSLPLLMGIDPLSESGLFQFGMIGYGLGVILLLFKRDLVSGWKNLLLLGLIDLPLEILIANISGRVYPHYYINIVPVLSLFAGLTFWVILTQLSNWDIPTTVKSVFQLSVIMVFVWSSIFNYAFEVRVIKQVSGTSIVGYIESHTSPDDYVLIWGAETAINFYTQRKSPTPYVYQYALYTPGYVNEQMILNFLNNVIQKRPQLIIDTKNNQTPMFEFPVQTKAIENRIAEVKSSYQVVERIGENIVYEYRDQK